MYKNPEKLKHIVIDIETYNIINEIVNLTNEKKVNIINKLVKYGKKDYIKEIETLKLNLG